MRFLHDPLAVYAAVLIASSAVRALPEPASTSSPAYRWFFAFTHALGANWDKVFEATRKEESK